MEMDVYKLSNTAAGNVAGVQAPGRYSKPVQTPARSVTDPVKAGVGQDPPVEEVRQAAADVQSRINLVNSSLNLVVDDRSDTVVVKIIDNETGEVIRQIPSEEILAIRERIDNLVGVLFDTKT